MYIHVTQITKLKFAIDGDIKILTDNLAACVFSRAKITFNSYFWNLMKSDSRNTCY